MLTTDTYSLATKNRRVAKAVATELIENGTEFSWQRQLHNGEDHYIIVVNYTDGGALVARWNHFTEKFAN